MGSLFRSEKKNWFWCWGNIPLNRPRKYDDHQDQRENSRIISYSNKSTKSTGFYAKAHFLIVIVVLVQQKKAHPSHQLIRSIPCRSPTNQSNIARAILSMLGILFFYQMQRDHYHHQSNGWNAIALKAPHYALISIFNWFNICMMPKYPGKRGRVHVQYSYRKLEIYSRTTQIEYIERSESRKVHRITL